MIYTQEALRTEPGTLRSGTGLLHYSGGTTGQAWCTWCLFCPGLIQYPPHLLYSYLNSAFPQSQDFSSLRSRYRRGTLTRTMEVIEQHRWNDE